MAQGQGRSRFALRVRPPGRRVDRPQGRRASWVNCGFLTRFRSRSMKKSTSRFFSQSPTRHLLSRTSTGTFQCRTITMLAPRPPHASLPPSRAALPPASTACHFYFNGGSTSRLLCAEPVASTQIDENEHDGPHVSSESQVVITTDTCPIDSRALGVGWVAWFGFACYGPAL